MSTDTTTPVATPNTPTTTVATPPAPAPKATRAKKTRKPRSQKKAKKASSHVGNGRALRKSQLRILQALDRADGALTKADILAEIREELPDASDNTGYLSAALGSFDKDVTKNIEERVGFPSLMTLGLVKGIEREFAQGNASEFLLTAAGKKAAATYHDRKPAQALRVENKVLDKAVKEWKSTHIYGLDALTDDDLVEIKKALGAGHKGLALDDLRQQIVNRRKQGAYSDPRNRERAAIKETLNRFGPEGTVKAGFLKPAQVEELTAMLANLNK